jgi:ATP-dependent RNA helicase DeaD
MNGRGYRAEALHGGMSQEQRDRVMHRLRGGTADLLSPPTSPPAGSTSTS